MKEFGDFEHGGDEEGSSDSPQSSEPYLIHKIENQDVQYVERAIRTRGAELKEMFDELEAATAAAPNGVSAQPARTRSVQAHDA